MLISGNKAKEFVLFLDEIGTKCKSPKNHSSVWTSLPSHEHTMLSVWPGAYGNIFPLVEFVDNLPENKKNQI